MKTIALLCVIVCAVLSGHACACGPSAYLPGATQVPIPIPPPPPPPPPQVMQSYDSTLMSTMYESMKTPPADGRARVRINWQYSLQEARKVSREKDTPVVMFFVNEESAKVAGEGPEGWTKYKLEHSGSSPTPTIFESHALLQWFACAGLDNFVKIPFNAENRAIAEEFNAPANSLVIVMPNGFVEAKFLGANACTASNIAIYLQSDFMKSFPTLSQHTAGRTLVKPITTLPSAFRFTDKVCCGPAPADERDFQKLKDLGIKSVICVDGTAPDAVTGKRYGMMSVHVPTTYDGISADTARVLARAVKDLPAPVYIHCNCGINRAPAAASMALITLGEMSAEDGVKNMNTIGVQKIFQGLYSCVEKATKVDARVLEMLEVRLKERAETQPIVKTMDDMKKYWKHLDNAAKTGWKMTEDERTDAAKDATELVVRSIELRKLPGMKNRPADFQKFVADGESAAVALEKVLNNREIKTLQSQDIDVLKDRFNAVTKSCVDCHTPYRDNIRR
jgi:protein tyrosine phosphatase (PTP) superfamily phosphohydrolase (DUF442 family)